METTARKLTIKKHLSDVLCSNECQTKKAFQYVKRMLLLFRAIVSSVLLTDYINKKVLKKWSTVLLGVKRWCIFESKKVLIFEKEVNEWVVNVSGQHWNFTFHNLAI